MNYLYKYSSKIILSHIARNSDAIIAVTDGAFRTTTRFQGTPAATPSFKKHLISPADCALFIASIVIIRHRTIPLRKVQKGIRKDVIAVQDTTPATRYVDYLTNSTTKFKAIETNTLRSIFNLTFRSSSTTVLTHENRIATIRNYEVPLTNRIRNIRHPTNRKATPSAISAVKNYNENDWSGSRLDSTLATCTPSSGDDIHSASHKPILTGRCRSTSYG